MADGDVASATPSSDEDTGDNLPFSIDLFEPTSETVCEFGDVILVADDGFHPAIKIQVSSCILAMASKVFRVLFSRRFADGQSMRANDRTPTEININDKPQTLLLLCKLLHLQGDLKPLTARQVLHLAITADKYDCVGSLRAVTYGIFALQQKTGTERYYGDEDRYIAAAYLLDQPEHFRYWTRMLVLSNSDCHHYFDAIHEFLPSNLIPSIKAQRHFVLHDMAFHLTNFIEHFNIAAFESGMPNYTRQLARNLSRSGLWPLASRTTCLQQYLLAMPLVTIPTLKADKYTEESVNRPPRPCCSPVSSVASSGGWGNNYKPSSPSPTPPEPSDPPTKEKFKDIAKRMKSCCVGVCLDCLKGNETCRVPHTSPWQAWQADSDTHVSWDYDLEPPPQPESWDSMW